MHNDATIGSACSDGWWNKFIFVFVVNSHFFIYQMTFKLHRVRPGHLDELFNYFYQ